MSRNLESNVREIRWEPNPRRPRYVPNGCRFHLHWRQRIGNQLPVDVLQNCSSRDSISNRYRAFPRAPRTSCIVPEPIERRSIDALRGLRYVIESQHVWRGRQKLYAFFLFDLPAVVGFNDTLRIRFAFENKCTPITDLS